jgi:hypothetical protein
MSVPETKLKDLRFQGGWGKVDGKAESKGLETVPEAFEMKGTEKQRPVPDLYGLK